MNARNARPRRVAPHLTQYGALELREGRNRPVWVFIDRGAGDQHGRARCGDACGVVRLDAAVDLQVGSEPALVEHGAERPYLVERALDELLAAEARTDAHDQD